MEEAITSRKRENRTQRRLEKLSRKHGGQRRESWQEAWDDYKMEKKKSQAIISSKIGRWEEEQAQKLHRLAPREREKEGRIRLKRSHRGSDKDQEIKLNMSGTETNSEQEIKDEIE